MAHNEYGWYSNDNRQNRPQSHSQNPVHNAQSLLAPYPLASATPASHVARHLDHMSITAAPPSFVNPTYYSNHRHPANPGHNTQQPPPPYTEYAQEIGYMAGPQRANDNGYWRQTAGNAVRMVQDQAGPSYPYPPPSTHIWPPSTYPSSHMAQTMFPHTQAASAYPTPPPPPSSSSSLAGALGPVVPAHAPRLPKPQPPVQSGQFFEEFLTQKTREMRVDQRNARGITPPHTNPVPSESPDPLALKSKSGSHSNFSTPRKRKPVVELSSPSFKKRNFATEGSSTKTQRPSAASVFGLGTPSSNSSTVPGTPSSSASTSVTPSTGRSVRRTLTLDHVEVPHKPWLTPVSSRKKSISSPSILGDNGMKTDDSPDDLGGYGTEEDSPSKGRSLVDTVKASARRGGVPDAALQKLSTLIDDIFSTEDSLPSEAEASDLVLHYFSAHSTDYSRPLLCPPILRKLTQYITNVSRPLKRGRHGGASALATPRNKGGRMTDMEPQTLSRLLRTLARSVKAGEDLDPFAITQHRAISTPKSPSKSPSKKAAGKKKADEGEPEGATAPEEQGPSDADFENLTRVLDIAKDSILAAECVVALLGSDRLTKQLYSEEIITSCLTATKNQLTKIIYPFVEGCSETNLTSIPSTSLLYHVVKHNSPQLQTHRKLLGEMFQALSAILPKINTLVGSESVAMSESIVIQAVYIAIGPFFIEGDGGPQEGRGKKEKEGMVAKTFGKSAMRGLRLHALSLIREIFASREDQRQWIVEEILSSLIKLSDSKQKAGQFRLRGGRSIRTVSALLLQLVQTSAHDVRVQAKKIAKARQQTFALKTQTSFTEGQRDEPFLDEHDHDEIRLYSSGLEPATKAAKTIILFLTQRSGKNKATKNSNEAEYRTIFDNLISDLLVVLFWPEWPAASLLLSVACKFMLASLDDVKSNNSDNNAAKTMALDHLGVIAAKIRSSYLKFQEGKGGDEKKSRVLKTLDDILKKNDAKELQRLVTAHQDVAAHLEKRASEDQAYDSAQDLSAATFGHDLAGALKAANGRLAADGDDDLNIKDLMKLRAFGEKIKDALRGVWKDHATDVFDVGTPEEIDRIDRTSEEVGSLHMMKAFFQPILNVILMALDASPIFMRTKALRALGQIVTSDATILSTTGVRRAIEVRLLDGSPAVRDAAVELIGKYMIEAPEVASEYYQKIAERIADTGLAVRKRVIKLLKAFYLVTNDVLRQVDIATRFVLRMMDEDDTVKELAIKTIEELWFPSSTPSVPASPSKRSTVLSQEIPETTPLVTKVAIIMGVSANFRDRQSPLEDLLHKIMAEKEGNEAALLHTRYAEMCSVLIDSLVDACDLPGFTAINCIRTIYLLTSAYPGVITSAHASTLLPFLKSPTNMEEQATADYLLKIFRASIPHMPKTTKFGQDLQTVLQPMIIKPSQVGGVAALQETVACICVVVRYLTHDYQRLVALLKSCNARLQEAIKRPTGEALAANNARALSTLIYLVSSLSEHCNFDQLRLDQPALAPNLNSISEGPIIEHIYNSLLSLHGKYDDANLRPRVLQCLGFLFRAQPTLMVLENSAAIMDSIFESPEEEGKARLLKIIQDFLVSESVKHSTKEKEGLKRGVKPADINMDELVGNTDGFADSGVASAVVQRYMSHILDAALSLNTGVQGSAIDILTFTVKQGLAHPLQSFPVIVALETSSHQSLSNRASALHAILQGKHASLLNTRYILSARASFDYQRKVAPDAVRGYRLQPTPLAVLQRWYSLVREKRQSRLDFLKALVKVFQENANYHSSQEDVDFARYMAENFSAFDYKTAEEVFTIIRFLTSVLSTAGTHILELLSPSHLLASLREPTAPTAPTAKPTKPESKNSDSEVLQIQEMLTGNPGEGEVAPMEGVEVTGPIPVLEAQRPPVELPHYRTSVIIAMVMLLKAHLKSVYGLSEEKCSKFVPGKKSAAGDKPASKRNDRPISWERLPFATKPILTTEDCEAQKTRFLEIWSQDGVTDEPEDDEMS
ncbi:Sister chromatid cohesion protein 2 [Marasmius sp. AFHP31]|nr:Sister chromatid cohesion protein 2 [Marasmius sp. AFHP31]